MKKKLQKNKMKMFSKRETKIQKEKYKKKETFKKKNI